MASTAAAAPHSIFAPSTSRSTPGSQSTTRRLEPIWEDPEAPAAPTRRLESIQRTPDSSRPAASDPRRAAIDAQLIAILDAALAPGETAADGFRRKEHELGAAFGTLSILEAHVMHARLANPRVDDLLAAKFARLVVDRRARLLAFIADARRRAALAHR